METREEVKKELIKQLNIEIWQEGLKIDYYHKLRTKAKTKEEEAAFKVQLDTMEKKVEDAEDFKKFLEECD